MRAFFKPYTPRGPLQAENLMSGLGRVNFGTKSGFDSKINSNIKSDFPKKERQEIEKALNAVNKSFEESKITNSKLKKSALKLKELSEEIENHPSFF